MSSIGHSIGQSQAAYQRIRFHTLGEQPYGDTAFMASRRRALEGTANLAVTNL